MKRYLAKVLDGIFKVFNPDHIDFFYLKQIDDEVIHSVLTKWKSESTNPNPDKLKLVAYADDIHLRLLDLNVEYNKSVEIYNKMFEKINEK